MKFLQSALLLTVSLLSLEASTTKTNLTTKGVKRSPISETDNIITQQNDSPDSASIALKPPQKISADPSRINLSAYTTKNSEEILKALKENPDMIFTVTLEVSPEGKTRLPKHGLKHSLVFSRIKHIVLETSGGALTKIPDALMKELRNLETLVLPEGVTEIGSEMCKGCTKLKSVTLPNSLKAIGGDAFAQCPIKSITLPEGLRKIGGFAFDGAAFEKLDLPKSLGEPNLEDRWPIDFGAFQNNKALKSVRIPAGIEQLGGTFAGCTALKEVTLPSTLLRIWNGTFADCASLERADIPDSVAVIGLGAFEGCKNMKSFVIPAAVTYIDSNAFSNCIRLETLEFKGNPPQSFATNFVDFTFSLKTVIIPRNSNETDYRNILTAIVNRFSSMYDIRSRYRDDLALSLPKGIPNVPKEDSEYMEQMKAIARVEQAGLSFYKSREEVDKEIATLGMTPEEVTKRKIDIVKK